MAEPHDPTAAADRYAAIEAAYCDDRWQDVLNQGRQLLEDLGQADDALAMALRQRVQLLMAHTHLHGLGDRDTAEDLYRQVLNTAHAEPALRRSAEEGLQQCDRPAVRAATDMEEPPPAAAEPTPAPAPAPSPAPERPLPEPVAPPLAVDPAMPFAAGIAASADGPIPAAATPWLEATPDPAPTTVPTAEPAPADDGTPAPPTPAPSLLAEVVEEPELLDVHRADPQRAEEIELELREAPSTAAAAAQVLAAAVTAEAMAEVKAARGEVPAPQAAEPTAEPLDDPLAAQTNPGVLEALPPTQTLTEPPPEPPSAPVDVAEAPPLLDDMEDDDDPDLLEGLLQVALG